MGKARHVIRAFVIPACLHGDRQRIWEDHPIVHRLSSLTIHRQLVGVGGSASNNVRTSTVL